MNASAPVSERVAVILESACRVVARDGAHGLRMAAVAEEAGVSKALVHYYFSTRRELLRHAFAFSEERLAAAVEELLAPLPNAAARLEHALLASLDPEPPWSEQRALWNEVWSTMRFDDLLRPLVEGAYGAWVERIVGLVRAGVEDADGGHYVRSRGSIASRTASPKRFSPKTDTAIAAPGKIASHGAFRMFFWAS